MENKTASWEKRNLGVDTIIFYVKATDSVQDVLEQLMQCDKEYQEIIISDANTDVLLAVQNIGFRVIEMGIHLSMMIDQLIMPSLYVRFEPYVTYDFANEEEIEYVLSKIETGDMFLTDKISRDPYFGARVAGKRYAFWLQDTLKDGSALILSKYKGKTIGFDIWENIGDNVYNGILGGLFPEFSGRGLGILPLYTGLLALKDQKAKKILSHVSSNNIPILKYHEMLGFSIDKMDYVLVKHQ